MNKAALLALVFALASPPGGAASDSPAKRILVLFPYEGPRPVSVSILHGLAKGLKTYPGSVALVPEFAQVAPPAPKGFDDRMRQWLMLKHSAQKFDVICAVRAEAVPLANALRSVLWPNAPVVFGMTSLDFDDHFEAKPWMTGATMEQADERTIRAALAMLPGTRHIALVGGAAPADDILNRALIQAIRGIAPSVDLIEIRGLTLPETKARVAALPQHTFVYVGSFIHDVSARRVVIQDLVAALSPVAAGPVFAGVDYGFGLGSVGGPMLSPEAIGQAMGLQITRIFEGARPENLPVIQVPPVSMVDWRELRRWNIPESRIPPGAEIQFRPPTLWDRHRDAILFVSAALLLQALVIGFLLVERRRRRYSEQSAIESEALSSAVLHSVSGCVTILDQNGKILSTAQRDRGQTNSDSPSPSGVGGDYLDLWKARVAAGDPGSRRVIEAVKAVLYGEASDRVVEYASEHDSEHRWTEIRIERLKRPAGGAVVSELDITARKRAELERRLDLDELYHLNRVAAVSQLASSLWHELAQPLTAILSNAQAAARFAERREPDVAEVRGALEDIVADDNRANATILRLRELLRKQQIVPREVDLNSIAEDVTNFLRSEAILRGVTLRLELADRPVQIQGDDVSLRQVLLNLCKNGMEAMTEIPAGTRILTVRTFAADDEQIGAFVVEDCGGGLSEETTSSLFTAFYTTKSDGLGMGLSICHSIVETLGGSFAAENRSGGGAAFRVELPLYRSSADAAPAYPAS